MHHCCELSGSGCTRKVVEDGSGPPTANTGSGEDTLLRASSANNYRKQLLSAVSCAIAISAPSALADTGAYERQISTVEDRIQVTRDSIRAKESEKTSLRRLLDNYNKQIAAVKKQGGSLKKKILSLQSAQQSGQAQGDTLRDAVKQRNDALAQQLRAMYQTGRSPHLRTLLSLDDPSASSRLLRYYQSVSRHRLQDIETARQSLGDVMTSIDTTASQAKQLLVEQQALKTREAELAGLSEKRALLLAKIETTLNQEQQRLSSLQEDRSKLQALVDELLAQRQAAADQGLNGRLPWPLVGELEAQFGQRKSQSNAEWAGIVISAAKGSPVVAVHEGQVVYAEWLRGFGLLLIVDHGNGMMSLYGNNEELMYNVGETVLPGDIIASVGDSSSINHTGLYFELRQDGSPVDPLGLLSEKVIAAKR